MPLKSENIPFGQSMSKGPLLWVRVRIIMTWVRVRVPVPGREYRCEYDSEVNLIMNTDKKAGRDPDREYACGYGYHQVMSTRLRVLLRVQKVVLQYGYDTGTIRVLQNFSEEI